MSTNINLNGIHELDLNLDGSTTASVAAGVVTVTNVPSARIELQTDGVDNGDQGKLNLVEGTNITLTDDGSGNVTIDASGGGGASIDLQTNSVDNTDQTKLNLKNGTNIVLTSDGVGGVVIDSSNPGGTVTSVGLVVPSRQTSSGGPVTSSGSITITDNTQSANTFFRGPASGIPATPAFGAIVPADLPIATTSALGAVEPDGTTITIASGKITAPGPGGVGFTVDGGASPPTPGIQGFIQVPYTGTITGWTVLTNVSGSIVFDVRKSTFAGYPTTTSIVASAPPTVSASQKGTSTTLTGWTTSVTAGDVILFILSSVSTVTLATVTLTIKRS